MMGERAVSAAGSARRRRELRLRAFHRHEAMSVRLALATALHHSAQRVGVEGVTTALDSGTYKTGFAGDIAPRAVPMKLGIMAGMVLMDSCSGMYKAGIYGDNAPRAVFFLVRRPMMLCIMAGMVQKDSYSVMCKAGTSGDSAFRAVFSSLVRRPMMRCIKAGMDQKDSCSGMYKAGIARDNAPRVVFSSLVGKPTMLGIVALMDQKDSCDMVPMFQTAETVESPQLQSFQVVDISFAAQRPSLMVQTVRRTIDIHQLPYTVIDVPVVQAEQVQTVRLTMDIPQLLNTTADVPVVRFHRSSSSLS